jgi:hypothetical protein
VASLLSFAAAAALFLAGLFFLVWRCGLAGLVFLVGGAGAFLWWFYRGNRPDMPPPGHPGRKM